MSDIDSAVLATTLAPVMAAPAPAPVPGKPHVSLWRRIADGLSRMEGALNLQAEDRAHVRQVVADLHAAGGLEEAHIGAHMVALSALAQENDPEGMTGLAGDVGRHPIHDDIKEMNPDESDAIIEPLPGDPNVGTQEEPPPETAPPPAPAGGVETPE